MNILKKIQRMVFINKVKSYIVNSNINKNDINEEIYKKYIEKKVLVKNISIGNVVKGVLTFSVPDDIKGKFNKILIISE